MSTIKEDLFPTVESGKDKLYRAAEGVSSLIPAGTSILHALIQSPFNQRLESWAQEVNEAIEDLMNYKKITLEQLEKNDTFVDFLVNLSQTSMKTSQKDKILYLKRAVVYSVTNEISDLDERMFYLNILDRLDAIHLRVLESLTGITIPEREVTNLFLDGIKKKHIYAQAISELQSLNLLSYESDNNYGFNVSLSSIGKNVLQLIVSN